MSSSIVAYTCSVVIVGSVGAVFLALPMFTSRRFLFGNSVSETVLSSAWAQRARATYEKQIGLSTAVAVTITICGLRLEKVWLLAAAIVLITGCGLSAYLVQWQRAKRYRVAENRKRIASLHPAPSLRSFWLLNVAALLPLIGTASYSLSNWNKFPAQIPIRWDAYGHPTHWLIKTTSHLLLPCFIGLIALAFLNLNLCLISARGRVNRLGEQSTLKHTAITVATVAWVLSIDFSLLTLIPLFRLPSRLFLGMLVADAIMIITSFLVLRRIPPQSGRLGDNTSDGDWRWGMFYVNPRDTALFVPKRFGVGYTANFGQPLGWMLGLGVPLVVIVAIVAILAK